MLLLWSWESDMGWTFQISHLVMEPCFPPSRGAQPCPQKGTVGNRQLRHENIVLPTYSQHTTPSRGWSL